MGLNIRDLLSLTAIYIQPHFEETLLSHCTGFLFKHNGSNYLVTNWHNVTGREPSTGKLKVNKRGVSIGVPDRLKLFVRLYSNQAQSTEATLFESLYDNGFPKTPYWFEHPIHGRNVNIVAIPISEIRGPDDSVLAANEPGLQFQPTTLMPGADVFMLGYPENIHGGSGTPIWKRGSVASEPDLDIDGLPKYYVDSTTRPGMSGSPVFFITTSAYLPEGNASKPNTSNYVLGYAHDFVGIYSGRVGVDEFAAHLAVVWKKSAIIEVIEGRKRGASSFLA